MGIGTLPDRWTCGLSKGTKVRKTFAVQRNMQFAMTTGNGKAEIMMRKEATEISWRTLKDFYSYP